MTSQEILINTDNITRSDYTSGEGSMTEKVVFGPVPSRRLGMSLGVNNVLYKNCSYSCVYCQLGRTQHFEIERDEYYNPEELVRIVIEAEKSDAPIDYITFVPDGEPTLDKNLGFEIAEIKRESSTKQYTGIEKNWNRYTFDHSFSSISFYSRIRRLFRL
jgi:organic radical activating enzyme